MNHKSKAPGRPLIGQESCCLLTNYNSTWISWSMHVEAKLQGHEQDVLQEGFLSPAQKTSGL